MCEVDILPCVFLAGIRVEQARVERLTRTVVSIHALVHEPPGAPVAAGCKLGEIEPGFPHSVLHTDVASHERRAAASLFFEFHEVFAHFPCRP